MGSMRCLLNLMVRRAAKETATDRGHARETAIEGRRGLTAATAVHRAMVIAAVRRAATAAVLMVRRAKGSGARRVPAHHRASEISVRLRDEDPRVRRVMCAAKAQRDHPRAAAGVWKIESAGSNSRLMRYSASCGRSAPAAAAHSQADLGLAVPVSAEVSPVVLAAIKGSAAVGVASAEVFPAAPAPVVDPVSAG